VVSRGQCGTGLVCVECRCRINGLYVRAGVGQCRYGVLGQQSAKAVPLLRDRGTHYRRGGNHEYLRPAGTGPSAGEQLVNGRPGSAQCRPLHRRFYSISITGHRNGGHPPRIAKGHPRPGRFICPLYRAPLWLEYHRCRAWGTAGRVCIDWISGHPGSGLCCRPTQPVRRLDCVKLVGPPQDRVGPARNGRSIHDCRSIHFADTAVYRRFPVAGTGSSVVPLHPAHPDGHQHCLRHDAGHRSVWHRPGWANCSPAEFVGPQPGALVVPFTTAFLPVGLLRL